MTRLRGEESDASRTIEEIVVSRGFKLETHQLETNDGYVLIIHRIVNPLIDPKKTNLRPVLLQHGFTSNSIHWLINSSDGHLLSGIQEPGVFASDQTSGNLGFALCKQGYDVWLGNFRGNRYSLRHKTLNINADEFWDFSFDDYIEHDLPSSIDYILEETDHESLEYVGHSQGTICMFGLLSSRPEYNHKVSTFIALAPIARLTHMKTPLKHLIPILNAFVSNFTGPGMTTEVMKPLISGHLFEGYLQKIFHNFLFLLSGFNWDQVDESRLNVYHSHPFADFSLKNLAHFFQIYLADKLVKFDYGKQANCKLYGQETPPEYELKKIICPRICLFHGNNDWFTTPEDLQFIRDSLTVPVYVDYQIPNKNWNHLDFLYGKDCGKFVNKKIIDILSLNQVTN